MLELLVKLAPDHNTHKSTLMQRNGIKGEETEWIWNAFELDGRTQSCRQLLLLEFSHHLALLVSDNGI